MIEKQKLDQFFQEISQVVLEAGQYALSKQGTVKNIGKVAEELEGDMEVERALRSAKTVIDEEVQERLLKAASKVIDPSSLGVDAEEKTPTTKLFRGNKKSPVLVLDPIDGTLEYLGGRDDYSVNVVLVDDHKIVTALVYFPKRDTLYFLNNNKAYLIEKFSSVGLKGAKSWVGKNNNSQKVFVNRRVSEDLKKELSDKEFEVVDDHDWTTTWLDGMFGCLEGRFKVSIFHTPQIRDVALGAILAKTSNGFALDWKGQPLSWPMGGRIPGVIFGVGECPKEVVEVLRATS